jgi:alpha-tubulin suppressor-like RCC1 family protein
MNHGIFIVGSARIARSLALVIALLLQSCVVLPHFGSLQIRPDRLLLAVGSSVTATVTGTLSCAEGYVCDENVYADYEIAGLPAGVSAEINYGLQSADTRLAARIALRAAPDAAPGNYSLRVRLYFRGDVQHQLRGSAVLPLVVQAVAPTGGAGNPGPIRSLSARWSRSLVVLADDTVWEWGTHDRPYLPVAVPQMHNIRSLAGVGAHSLALLNGGTVMAEGYNSEGQLGDGTRDSRLGWAAVAGLSGVEGIAASDDFSLARLGDGTVWTWGRNIISRLGDGTPAEHLQPVQVAGLSDIQGIAAGDDHALALRSDGTVWAWGSNWLGQLGQGDHWPSSIATPVAVQNLRDVADIAAGTEYSLALRSDGSLWGWGQNTHGQLGIGEGSAREVDAPVRIESLSEVRAVAAAGGHALALLGDGTVWAWGRNEAGQLGDGTRSDRHTPVRVGGLTDVRAIAAGGTHSLVLTACDQIWSWGDETGRPIAEPAVAVPPEIVPGIGQTSACPEVSLRLSVQGNGGISGDGLICTPPCIDGGGAVARGSTITLTAIPAADSAFDIWQGDCQGLEPRTALLMDRDKSCTAIIHRTDGGPYLLRVEGSVASSAGGILGPDRIDCPTAACNAIFPAGTPVTLTITGDPGRFLGWRGDCQGQAGETVVVMNGHKSCSAQYSPPPPGPIVTLSLAVSGAGHVTSTPVGIACGTDCSNDWSPGTGLRLTAIADNGWRFAVWGGDCEGNTAQLDFRLNHDLRCTASFVSSGTALLRVRTVNAAVYTPEIAGIDCGSDCDHAYVLNSVVWLRANPPRPAQFATWSGCDYFRDPQLAGAEQDCGLLMNADREVQLARQRTYELRIPVPTGGRVVSNGGYIDCGLDCTETLLPDTPVSLTAQPDSGWRFERWSGDCTGTGATAALSMNADKSCTASFAQQTAQPTLTVVKTGTLAGSVRILSSQGGIADGRIDCGTSCSAAYESGTGVLLRLDPALSDPPPVQWIGCDSVSPGVGGSTCSVTLTASRTVTAGLP